MIDYVKIGMVILALLGVFYYGWHTRDRDFSAYKMEIQTATKAQEAKVESIEKQHALVTKGIQDEYDAKLALLRNYYASGVRQPSASVMPNLSTTTSIANATAAYNELASNCAQTTLMLVELQKWIAQQVGIANE